MNANEITSKVVELADTLVDLDAQFQSRYIESSSDYTWQVRKVNDLVMSYERDFPGFFHRVACIVARRKGFAY